MSKITINSPWLTQHGDSWVANHYLHSWWTGKRIKTPAIWLCADELAKWFDVEGCRTIRMCFSTEEGPPDAYECRKDVHGPDIMLRTKNGRYKRVAIYQKVLNSVNSLVNPDHKWPNPQTKFWLWVETK